MFRITEDPSSGSLVQSLAKNDKNGSIVSVDMYRVGVMAAYCDLLCVCAVHCVGACVQFTVWVRVCSSLCGKALLGTIEHFYMFYILIVSTNCILCINWIIKCLSLMHGANMKIT